MFGWFVGWLIGWWLADWIDDWIDDWMVGWMDGLMYVWFACNPLIGRLSMGFGPDWFCY